MLERPTSQWLDFFRWFGGKKRSDGRTIRASSAALRGVQLPPRSQVELDASAFQRQKLADYGEHDYATLDNLGKEQAKYLLHYLDREASERQEQAQLAEARGFLSNVLAVLCFGIMAVVGTLALREHKENAASASSKSTDSPIPTASSTPVPPPSATMSPAEFQRKLADSQTRAVRAHPSLGVAGSHFNVAFTARYKRMVQQQDSRLASPDWPEKLADECARQLPAAFH